MANHWFCFYLLKAKHKKMGVNHMNLYNIEQPHTISEELNFLKCYTQYNNNNIKTRFSM